MNLEKFLLRSMAIRFSGLLKAQKGVASVTYDGSTYTAAVNAGVIKHADIPRDGKPNAAISNAWTLMAIIGSAIQRNKISRTLILTEEKLGEGTIVYALNAKTKELFVSGIVTPAGKLLNYTPSAEELAVLGLGHVELFEELVAYESTYEALIDDVLKQLDLTSLPKEVKASIRLARIAEVVEVLTANRQGRHITLIDNEDTVVFYDTKSQKTLLAIDFEDTCNYAGARINDNGFVVSLDSSDYDTHSKWGRSTAHINATLRALEAI